MADENHVVVLILARGQSRIVDVDQQALAAVVHARIAGREDDVILANEGRLLGDVQRYRGGGAATGAVGYRRRDRNLLGLRGRLLGSNCTVEESKVAGSVPLTAPSEAAQVTLKVPGQFPACGCG